MIILGIILLLLGGFLLFNYRIVDKYKPFYLYAGCFLFCFGFICIIQPILNKLPDKKEEAKLVISSVYVYTEDNRVKCNFKLENQDNHPWYYIKVKVDFKDSNDNVIKSKEQTIVGQEGLSLYKYYTIDIDIDIDDSIKDASVYIVDCKNAD